LKRGSLSATALLGMSAQVERILLNIRHTEILSKN
jgi:hypothetical protein